MIVLRELLRFVRAAWFVVFFVYELIIANAIVAWEIITPRHYMRPGIIRVPIRSTRNIEITLLANLVSLTPGTLSLEVSKDGDVLYVHALHIVSPDKLRWRIRRLENMLLKVIR